MKAAVALFAIFFMLFAMIAPSPAWAAGGWHGGHGGWHGGHRGGGGCCWWWPAALVGGLALGAVALATAPIWALAPSPPVVEPAPAAYAPPVYAAAPQPAYAAPQPAYAAAPVSAAPAYVPSQPPPFQREVVYQDGRYLLFGDGVRHPWQWVWVPAGAPPAPPPPPR